MEQKMETVDSLLDTLNEVTKILRTFQSVVYVQTKVFKDLCIGVYFSILVRKKWQREEFAFHYEIETGEPYSENQKEFERLSEFIKEL